MSREEKLDTLEYMIRNAKEGTPQRQIDEMKANMLAICSVMDEQRSHHRNSDRLRVRCCSAV